MERFRQPRSKRRVHKRFVIAVEGEKSEKAYFDFLQHLFQVSIKTLTSKSGNSSPDKVVHRLKKEAQKAGRHKEDQYWIVVDRDSWNEEIMHALYRSEFSVAVSNPCFEVWLHAHLFTPAILGDCNSYVQKIRRQIQSFDKNLCGFNPNSKTVNKAVLQMKQYIRFTQNNLWPDPGGSDLFKLVAEIMSASKHR
ncbi:MAG: hypothetical protein ETSY2_38395 [Candidatus Entotheonella gemina]|uniref:Abortive phage resistance protein n=1 Tax=Candidatus Entotheonella gemina TaxID=1429439 RepID=W4LT11_9BACT|nr:MAG: hypothetical protein ETSY2_38395 [Candidatus Entotheonella gemina]